MHDIKKMFSNTFGIPEDKITDETKIPLEEDDADIKLETFISDIEHEYIVHIPDNDVSKLHKFGDIMKYVQKKKNGNTSG